MTEPGTRVGDGEMDAEMSTARAWLIASRPQTLPAAAAPVIVGTGIAYAHGLFALLPALAALGGALLIQIGTNFANDYYDAVQGADTESREGFTRVTAGGLIAPERVKTAMWLTFATAVLAGIPLVYIGGLPIVVVGLASVAAGIAYTGGPYPLGYHGLGDVFVFVFFGLVAVTGTYYVQATALIASPLPLTIPAGTIPLEVIIAALPVAALSTNILVVNNVRDREEDAETGKRTLAVRYGYRFSRIQYLGLLGLAYIVPVWFAITTGSLWPLAPLATLPLAYRVASTVVTETAGNQLNPALEWTGRLLAAFAVLFGLGVAV
ncbi:MAG: 1,4-dihydroxy-2-naphthoate octaprenyltransferase [Halorubrum sp. J07HR59]|nr:MAG: 1,4-dihydroxy-2-naphthoate octaprenyltransferase [Halorubrum sp. J07HR59]